MLHKTKTSKNSGFMPAPPIGAEAHKKVMKRLETMTFAEALDLAVRAGIYTPDGQLTEHYRASKA